ncbi:unnamed protein product [Boreogadus saida]
MAAPLALLLFLLVLAPESRAARRLVKRGLHQKGARPQIKAPCDRSIKGQVCPHAGTPGWAVSHSPEGHVHTCRGCMLADTESLFRRVDGAPLCVNTPAQSSTLYTACSELHPLHPLLRATPSTPPAQSYTLYTANSELHPLQRLLRAPPYTPPTQSSTLYTACSELHPPFTASLTAE